MQRPPTPRGTTVRNTVGGTAADPVSLIFALTRTSVFVYRPLSHKGAGLGLAVHGVRVGSRARRVPGECRGPGGTGHGRRAIHHLRPGFSTDQGWRRSLPRDGATGDRRV